MKNQPDSVGQHKSPKLRAVLCVALVVLGFALMLIGTALRTTPAYFAGGAAIVASGIAAEPLLVSAFYLSLLLIGQALVVLYAGPRVTVVGCLSAVGGVAGVWLLLWCVSAIRSRARPEDSGDRGHVGAQGPVQGQDNKEAVSNGD